MARRSARTPRFARRTGRFGLVGDTMLALVVLALLAAVALRWERQQTRQLDGIPVVADGDTLVLSGQRLRLAGLDAPELSQTCGLGAGDYPCGRKARQALAALLAEQATCRGWERDRYGRLLVRCRTEAGIDAGGAMVSQGWAVAYGDYVREEAEARAAGRGLWAGRFDRPREWRQRHGGLAEGMHDWIGSLVNWVRQMAGGPVPASE